MRPTLRLQYGRIYRLPGGTLVVAQPAMDETMRFRREADVSDFYTREQWREASFAELTVRPDGQVFRLEVNAGTIEAHGAPAGFTVHELEPTASVLGCEFCGGFPWPGDRTVQSGHGSHEPGCPLLSSR